ncbi:MAG: hypothetical protein KUG77_14250, partial [Nannocystaceae bacterium]|nr:hypothetical protein [Nannocystaceae bacterium]
MRFAPRFQAARGITLVTLTLGCGSALGFASGCGGDSGGSGDTSSCEVGERSDDFQLHTGLGGQNRQPR